MFSCVAFGHFFYCFCFFFALILNSGIQNDPQPSITQANQGSDPMADLLSDLGNSQPMQSQQQQSGGGGLEFDIFSGLGGGNQNNNSNQNGNMNMNSGGINSLMSAASVARGFAADNLKSARIKLNAFPKSHDSDQALTSDSTLQLSYFNVYKQQQSSLCIFVSNLTNNAISNITVGASTNANIQLSYDFGNSEPKPKPKNVYTGIIPQLNGNETACQLINFGAANPTNLALPCVLNVNVQYQNGNLSGQVGISSRDLVRPYMMSTQQFGEYWLKLNGGEVSFQKRGSINNVQDYVNLITKLQYHHIQTIQSECIAAGQITSVTNANMGIPCLVHASVK